MEKTDYFSVTSEASQCSRQPETQNQQRQFTPNRSAQLLKSAKNALG